MRKYFVDTVDVDVYLFCHNVVVVDDERRFIVQKTRRSVDKSCTKNYNRRFQSSSASSSGHSWPI